MSNQHLLWRATCEIGDWFSRLGGANCYRSMIESEVFLYVGCKTLDKKDDSNLVEEFVHPKFLEFGKVAIDKANMYLAEISATDEELNDLVAKYLKHYDQKLRNTNEVSERWEHFLQKFDSGAV